MTGKISDAFLDHAQKLIEAGATLKEASAGLCNPDELSKKLRGRGVVIKRTGRPAPNRAVLPESEIIAAYLTGESELSIATRHGISRNVIRRIILAHGIEPRTSSEANFLRMERTTASEREILTAKARQTRVQNLAADAFEDKANFSIGMGEKEIIAALTALGHTVIHQEVIDGYVIDIAIGNIAIEIRSKCYSTFIDERPERREHLFKCGKQIVGVAFRDYMCIVERMNEIVALIDFACRHPAPIGEYWMIQCRRHKASVGAYIYDTTIERRTPHAKKTIS